ncbi:uncharacterized protein At1g08160-like [Humulus lupulus]|uniref:uncharacterized protein At1g08160-like n=1 Tax=Humulus lupulus TaxID=3486 RepID=UPI002B412340|nr:uncharacterized protein At1g08160-like [Humulus lupulus]
MTNPSQQTPGVAKPTRPGHHRILRMVATFFLGLIVLVGLAVLIIWLVLRPKRLVFSVEDASVHNFHLSNDNHLNATFDFVVRSYNPNTKVSIYFDSIESDLNYDDQTLAFSTVSPFFQPRRNVTRLQVKLTASSTALFSSVSKDLRLEKKSGEVELNLDLKARIRYRVGVWKSSHRTLKIFCSSVLVDFSKSKTFDRTYCDVEI